MRIAAKNAKVDRNLLAPVKKESAYEQFILWSAMPPIERMKLGIQTQEEFAEKNFIAASTTTMWRKRPDFQKRVEDLRRHWAFDKTSDVIYGIFSSVS